MYGPHAPNICLAFSMLALGDLLTVPASSHILEMGSLQSLHPWQRPFLQPTLQHKCFCSGD
jgi:hypothetical protein